MLPHTIKLRVREDSGVFCLQENYIFVGYKTKGMKHILYILLLAAVAACTPQDNPDTVDIFDYSPKSAEIPAEGGTFTVEVTTNQDYYCEIHDDWLYELAGTVDSKDTHRFKVLPNTGTGPRESIVSFCTDNACMVFRVVQLGKEDSESGEGDKDEGEDSGTTDTGTEAEVWTSAFRHRSLAMRITADWCPSCPYMASSFEYARTLLPDGLEIVSIHDSGELKFTDSNPYRLRMNVTGYPTGVVDSRAKIPNYSSSSFTGNIVKNVSDETVSAYPAKTGIAVSSTVEGRTVTAEVKVYVKEADDYKVYALLLEDDHIGYQSGAGENYEHDHVARMQLSSAYGDQMKIEADKTIWTRTYTVTVPDTYNLSNMKVLVYVEKPYGDQTVVKNVYYAEYQDFGDTYVDNSRSVKVGETGSLELL